MSVRPSVCNDDLLHALRTKLCLLGALQPIAHKGRFDEYHYFFEIQPYLRQVRPSQIRQDSHYVSST